MATLILTDVHGNLPALRSVLATPEARSCREVISLGDHVNFGPCSREVHNELRRLGAVMLMGNHEERLTRPADAEFDGYNWALLRWTAAQMNGVPLQLPVDVRRGSTLFTHGTPGDPYHLVYPADLPRLLDDLDDGLTLLITGHNHTRWDVTHGQRRAVNPGSAGMAEDGEGGTAPFAVLEGNCITLHQAAYDVRDVLRAYVATGAAQAAPEMCRACARVMATGEYQGVLKLVRHVTATAADMGLALGHRDAWHAADLTYPWQEKLPSREFWAEQEKHL